MGQVKLSQTHLGGTQKYTLKTEIHFLTPDKLTF